MASKRGLYKKANSESSSTIHNEKRCAIREYCMYLQVPAPDLRFSASAVGPANTSPKIGYIESAEQSRTAEQNKISKLTVKLQIISTEHDCRM